MFKINQLNEVQEAEDKPVPDPGKYKGTSPEHYVCNGFKEICLSGIEDKSHFEFIECGTSYCDENNFSLISDRKWNLSWFTRSEKYLWTEPGIAREIGQSGEEESRRIWEGHIDHN